MIDLSWQLLLAFLLDLLLGDPRRLPHPVKAIAKLALALETPLRCRFAPRRAGMVAVAVVVTATVALTWLLVAAAARIHPLLGDLFSILLLYSSLALQDLRRHALAVYQALLAADLPLARQRVAMLVGRDTEHLDEPEIVRATVESVAENTVDGVTAPLLFALLAGAPGALFYKAVNTLDSTFGYRNERYLEFGWAAAKLDDLVNFIPARLTALLVFPAAALCRLDAARAWRTFRRDRHQHPSPNGGQIEAAMAGALRVRLGGENRYFGVPTFRPFLGQALAPLNAEKIIQTIRLMMVTTGAALVSGLSVYRLWQ